MTKGNMLSCTTISEMKRSSVMCQNNGEDVISPCKEKMQQIISCCHDMAQRLDSLQFHLESDRVTNTLMAQGDDSKNMEILLLQDKLQRSEMHIGELQIRELNLTKKIAEMEEKIQTLSAQLVIYKEDFDLERKDREVAQGKVAELEQKLLVYQRLLEQCPPLPQSERRHRHHCHYHHTPSIELVARSHDVCDAPETDGHIEPKATASAAVKESSKKKAPLSDLESDSCQSIQLMAQSFDIRDFLPSFSSSKPTFAETQHLFRNQKTVNGKNTFDTRELCADRIEVSAATANSQNQKLNLAAVNSRHESVCRWDKTSTPVGINNLNDVNLPHGPSHISSSTLEADEFKSFQSTVGNLNLVEASSFPRHTLASDELENSMLKCPKCLRSYSLSDHIVFLEHLEQC